MRKLLLSFLLLSAIVCPRAGLLAQGQQAASANADSQVDNPVRVPGDVTQGLLIKRVQPQYPKNARKKHIQGTVIFRANIGTDGLIHDLTLVSGEPSLAKSAIEAVRQWEYKPYMVNGQPVAVETQITVNFTLGGR